MSEVKITEDMIATLRIKVRGEVSYARYLHILGVEGCASEMAELFSEVLTREDKNIIRASAILHDVTKDKGLSWYNEFIRQNGIHVPDGESTQLYHTLTAPDYIRLEYPDFSHSAILSAVSKHTTGDGEMTLTDKIICLSDYIEDGRKNASCTAVREYFKEFDFNSADIRARENHLDKALLSAFEYTRDYVVMKGFVLSERTIVAINALDEKIKAYENAK